MSVRGKRRVGPHVHGSSDIKDMEQTPQLKHIYRGISVGDIITDEDANNEYPLYSAMIKTTRFWEAEDPIIIKGSNTTIESDATASGGRCIKRASGAPNGSMWYGPYRKIGGGEYYAVFNLKVASNASSSSIITIDVYSITKGAVLDSGATANGAYMTLKPSDFIGGSNKWHQFRIKFTCREDWIDIELRGLAFVGGITDIYCDWVGVVPACVPFDVTGITNPNTATPAWNTNINPDNMNTGITNPNNAQGYTKIKTQAVADSEVTLTQTSQVLTSGSCSSESDATDLALVHVEVFAGGTHNTDDHVLVRIYTPHGEIRFTVWNRSGWDHTLIFNHLIIGDLSGDTVSVYGERAGSSGTCTMRALIEVWQYKKHTHVPTDPTHDTKANTGQDMETVTHPHPNHTHVPSDPRHMH